MTIRVIVVDDSAMIRHLLVSVLQSDPEIHVVATACDPYDAREKIKQYHPDVITLDVEMPQMNGIEFLEKIMRLRPMPVIMFSSLTSRGAETSLRALELGAVETMGKPERLDEAAFLAMKEEILLKVRAAAQASLRPFGIATPAPLPPYACTASAATHALNGQVQLIAIGASTGGVDAIRQILHQLRPPLPPIVITQHMPESFLPSFARRLQEYCAFEAQLAGPDCALEAGHIYVAPGEGHVVFEATARGVVCQIDTRGKVSGHCPSVDVMFHAAAEVFGGRALGVLLTGMGRDGADGLLHLHQEGATTLVQDEASCVVYGMPRAAFELGAAGEQLSLSRIASRIEQLCVRAPV